MPGGRYELNNAHRIDEWVVATDAAERAEGLFQWLELAAGDPYGFSHGFIERQNADGRRLRRLYFADVPGAMTRVAFQIIDYPVRYIDIRSLDDDAYKLP